MRHTLTAALAALAVSATAQAQYTLYIVEGDAINDEFGLSVDILGDVDGDGADDFVVGAIQDQATTDDPGYVRVFSGRTGALIREHVGSEINSRLGTSVSNAGDVDGDGVTDYIAGAPGLITASGEAFVWSGATGAELLHLLPPIPITSSFGIAVSGAGDLDGDGYDEVIVGSRYDSTVGPNVGSARVYSGRDGSEKFVFLGFPGTTSFGRMVARAGDVNADGTMDILVGNGAGYARVYSGADGSSLHFFLGGVFFGMSGTCAGDLDGDGHDDIAIGNPHMSGETVKIFSGATGVLLREIFEIPGGGGFSYDLHLAGDVDGGGMPDLFVAAPFGLSEACFVFAGEDGSLIRQFDSAGDDEQFSRSLSAGGDLNGDGVLDFLIGAPDSNVIGRAFVISGADCPLENYCTAKLSSGGCVPFIRSEGCPSLSGDDDFSVVAGEVNRDSFGVFFWGFGELDFPFAGGTLCVQQPIVRTEVQNSGGFPWLGSFCTGTYSFAFTQAYMASQSLRPSDELYGQYWFRDSGFGAPNNVGMTEGLHFTIQP